MKIRKFISELVYCKEDPTWMDLSMIALSLLLIANISMLGFVLIMKEVGSILGAG